MFWLCRQQGMENLFFELIPVYCELLVQMENSPITILMSPLNATIDQQLKVFGNQVKRLSPGKFYQWFNAKKDNGVNSSAVN